MKIDDNQKVQFIVLSVLIVCVLGFGIYRLTGSTSAPAQSSGKHSSSSVKKSASSDNSAVTVSALSIRPLVKGRDPFTPQINAMNQTKKTEQIKHNVKPVQNPNKATKGAPVLPSVVAVGKLDAVPAKAASSCPAGDKKNENNPLKNFKLTGLLRGDVCMAIIQGSGNVRYIIREGQMIDGGFVVKHIWKNGVWLERGSERFLLRLEGDHSIEKATRA